MKGGDSENGPGMMDTVTDAAAGAELARNFSVVTKLKDERIARLVRALLFARKGATCTTVATLFSDTMSVDLGGDAQRRDGSAGTGLACWPRCFPRLQYGARPQGRACTARSSGDTTAAAAA